MVGLGTRCVLVLLSPLLLAFSPPTCAMNGSADLRLPIPEQKATGYDSSGDLLAAIADGEFDSRAQLENELSELTVPHPVQIEFTEGADLDASQGPAIDSVVGSPEGDFQLRADLIGCSDGTDSPAQNRRVSQERAEAVAKQLRSLDVAPWQIGDVVGRGESCEPKARRVEVRFQLMDVPKSLS